MLSRNIMPEASSIRRLTFCKPLRPVMPAKISKGIATTRLKTDSNNNRNPNWLIADMGLLLDYYERCLSFSSCVSFSSR